MESEDYQINGFKAFFQEDLNRLPQGTTGEC